MAVTFNPYEGKTLDYMGAEMNDPRLVSNEDVEELLNGLIKNEPENGKFFKDCIDELKKNWDVFNTMTLEDILSILNKL